MSDSIEQKIIQVSAKALWSVIAFFCTAAFILGTLFHSVLYRLEILENWKSDIVVLADNRDVRIKNLENLVPLFTDKFERLFYMVDRISDKQDTILKEMRESPKPKGYRG